MTPESLFSTPDTSDFFLYTETAFHHEGDDDYMEKLIAASASAQADGIKFQVLLDPDEAYSSKLAHYGTIERWCFGRSQWQSFFGRARELGLQTVGMPLDSSATSFLLQNSDLVSAYEVHSISFNEYPMLCELAGAHAPVFLGIGGRTVSEIAHAKETLAGHLVALVYGLQNFPTQLEDVNLSRLPEYARLFQVPMGYADHSSRVTPEVGTSLSAYAYVLGSRIFERHITLDPSDDRTDHHAAVDAHSIRQMRRRLLETQAALGTKSTFELTAFDTTYRDREKQLVYRRRMAAGQRLDAESLAFMVTPGQSDFEQIDFARLIGRVLTRKVTAGSPVVYADIAPRED